MRVLVAIDGSASSDAACKLVGSLDWPEGTCIRVLAVIDPAIPVYAGLNPYAIPADDPERRKTALRTALADAVALLEAPGRGVESRLVDGRPASVIVAQAQDYRAELIVMGSRGMGRLASMLLGSVSAEVVDHAPCAVLVARGSSVGRVLLATDGSGSARLAVDHVGGTGYLAGRPVEVIAVAPGLPTPAPLTAVDATDALFRNHAEHVSEVRARAEATAARAAEELGADGFEVRWSITAGDPAHEIIEAAASLGCDLIAMGSRGLTGLQRILLGSVARNVLLHTPSSVLIVREPVRVRLPERRRASARRALAGFAG